MNTLIIITTLLAISLAAPVDKQVADVSQDTLGNYKVLYKTDRSSRIEERLDDGSTIGAYSYVDDKGELQRVVYSSGKHGFRASGKSLPEVDLPNSVQYTPEVAAARAHHLAIVDALKGSDPVVFITKVL